MFIKYSNDKISCKVCARLECKLVYIAQMSLWVHSHVRVRDVSSRNLCLGVCIASLILFYLYILFS